MRKRARDADVDEERLRLAVKEALKKIRPELAEEEERSSKSIEKLTSQFNEVLADVVNEEGMKAKKMEGDDLIQFTGVVRYPNEIDSKDIQDRLLKVDDGVACITYEANGAREMKMTISVTTNKALKMQYIAQEQREVYLLAQKAPPVEQPSTKVVTDAEMVLHAMKTSLVLDTTQTPVIQGRSIGEGIEIVSVSIAVQSPLKNYQIERVASQQSRKIKNLRIGPHPSVNTIRMTVEIYCSSAGGLVQ
jgi:hypothetical protein